MPSIAKFLYPGFAALVLTLPAALHPTPMAAQAPEPPASSIVRLDPALDKLLAPDAKVERLATGFNFLEGPQWRHGRMWFVDTPGNKLRAVTPDGKVTELLTADSGFENFISPNGNAPDPQGGVIMAEQDGRRVIRITGPDNALKVETLFDSYEGSRLNSPNDIVFAHDGSFYFTDPPYGLKGMDKSPDKKIPFNGVYHYKDGKLTAIIRDLTLPNGIALTPDNKTLYVANSGPHMMYMKYPVLADGTVGTGTMLIDFPPSRERGIPDGLKLDSQGNLWASSPGGIRVITPEGKVLGQIKLPETVSNLAWGEDGKTLYITATHSVYRLQTLVQGVWPEFRK